MHIPKQIIEVGTPDVLQNCSIECGLGVVGALEVGRKPNKH